MTDEPVIQSIDITCECGNKEFHLEESWEGGDYLSHKIGTLSSVLTCTKCNAKSPPFKTSIIGDNKDGDWNPQPAEKKKCPMCSKDTFITVVVMTSIGFLDLTEISHRVGCTAPGCPWTLDSIARSIHSEEHL